MKHFPIGFDDFEELVRKNDDGTSYYHFVDKTLLIRDILNNDAHVSLFTRPRRFCKTTNMDMLRCFFDIREAGRHRNLFTSLKVESATVEKGSGIESCLNYQGKYPVVFITFKSCSFNTFEETYAQIKYLVRKLYSEHQYLLESSQLQSYEKVLYERILNQTATDADYNNAIKLLTEYLYKHHYQKVIVLIDEYDTPFQSALYNKYYEQLLPVMRVLIGGVLKGNHALEKAVLTGVLRMSDIGANNVRARTVLDYEFSEYFGFTEEEVITLLSDMGKLDKLEELKDWYGGYQFGNTIIYNPWSVMKCLSQNFNFQTYWVYTSDDQLIKDLLLKSPANMYQDMATLMSNQSAEVSIYNSALRFDDDLQADEHLWTLLLSTGYLKSIQTIHRGVGIICHLKIPNKEVSCVYTSIFADWLERQLINTGQSSLIEHLLTGQAEEFGEELKKLYLQIVSVHDVRDDYIEAFYHGFMVGIIGLSKISHAVYLQSNRESGYGRYDLALEPKNLQHPKYHVGIILEFKRTTKPETLSDEAQRGLDQVKTQQYISDFQMRGVNRIIIMGIAFCGKEIAYVYEQLDRPQPISGQLASAASAASLVSGLSDSPVTGKRGRSDTDTVDGEAEVAPREPKQQRTGSYQPS